MDNLLVEVVELKDRRIEVKEASGLMSIRRSRMFDEIASHPDPDDYVQAFLLNVYVNLVCCSFGDLPKDTDEFLSMKEADIEAWTAVARKVNPHWFGWLDNAERLIGEMSKDEIDKLTPKQKEKKSRKRLKSS